jgi:hypothetical protein
MQKAEQLVIKSVTAAKKRGIDRKLKTVYSELIGKLEIGCRKLKSIFSLGTFVSMTVLAPEAQINLIF